MRGDIELDKQKRIEEIDEQIKRLMAERKELNGERLMVNERIYAIRQKWNLAGAIGEKISYIARSAVTSNNGDRVIPYKNMTKKQQTVVKELVNTIIAAYEDAFKKEAWEETE